MRTKQNLLITVVAIALIVAFFIAHRGDTPGRLVTPVPRGKYEIINLCQEPINVKEVQPGFFVADRPECLKIERKSDVDIFGLYKDEGK